MTDLDFEILEIERSVERMQERSGYRMNTKVLIVANILAFTGAALAAQPNIQSKPKACAVFSVATLKDGSRLGVCEPSKSGGKATFLRAFEVVKVTDPATGAAVSIMVGFQ